MRKTLKFLLAFSALLLLGATAHAQGVRIGPAAVTAQGTIGSATNAVVLPNSPTVVICQHPANGVPCTNYAATFTDATLTTQCPQTNQIVLDGTTSCRASTDSQNNWGAWVKPGQYDYVVTLPGAVNLGPFFVTASLPVNPNVQIVSTVPTGTAPFSIASTTVVPNLNAGLLSGQSAPASAILGLTDAQAPTNKTIDISQNTLKSSTNTSGHVPRNNGTQYVDAQLAAADLSDGVVGSGPIVKATALQGTDANVLTSGTVSASTGVALCTDANHGATTSGCTAGGVTEAAFPCLGAVTPTVTVDPSTICGYVLFPNAHTLTRFTALATVVPSGCVTQAVIGFRDETTPSTLQSLTITNGASFDDSGAISVSMTAGHKFAVAVTTAAATCGTNPTIVVGAVYQ